jgi:hypothetical protein
MSSSARPAMASARAMAPPLSRPRTVSVPVGRAPSGQNNGVQPPSTSKLQPQAKPENVQARRKSLVMGGTAQVDRQSNSATAFSARPSSEPLAKKGPPLCIPLPSPVSATSPASASTPAPAVASIVRPAAVTAKDDLTHAKAPAAPVPPAWQSNEMSECSSLILDVLGETQFRQSRRATRPRTSPKPQQAPRL